MLNYEIGDPGGKVTGSAFLIETEAVIILVNADFSRKLSLRIQRLLTECNNDAT